MADGVIVPVAPFTLTTNYVDIYGPVPDGFVAMFKGAAICNRDTVQRGVALRRQTAAAANFQLRANGTSTAQNKIGPEDTENWNIELYLDEGERIQGKGEVGSMLDVHFSVIEVEKTT